MSLFPDHVMRTTAQRAQVLGQQWRSETPMRIHSREIAEDGSPEWSVAFSRWMTRSQRPPVFGSDEQLRATRVFRQLRKTCPREFEVAYRLLMLNESVTSTLNWLNQRAQANGIALPPGKSVHYTERDVVALFIAGVDWAYQHL